jgi:hypothetical protein
LEVLKLLLELGSRWNQEATRQFEIEYEEQDIALGGWLNRLSIGARGVS